MRDTMAATTNTATRNPPYALVPITFVESKGDPTVFICAMVLPKRLSKIKQISNGVIRRGLLTVSIANAPSSSPTPKKPLPETPLNRCPGKRLLRRARQPVL